MPVYKAGKLSIHAILPCKISDSWSCNRAVKIVLDRAMSGMNISLMMMIVFADLFKETYLPVIVQACKKENPLDTREKAVSSLHLLTRRGKDMIHYMDPHMTRDWFNQDSNRPALLAAGVLDILVETLKDTEPPMSESAQRYAAVAICDLIQGSGKWFRFNDIGMILIMAFRWLQVLHCGAWHFGFNQTYIDIAHDPQQWTTILDIDDTLSNHAYR